MSPRIKPVTNNSDRWPVVYPIVANPRNVTKDGDRYAPTWKGAANQRNKQHKCADSFEVELRILSTKTKEAIATHFLTITTENARTYLEWRDSILDELDSKFGEEFDWRRAVFIDGKSAEIHQSFGVCGHCKDLFTAQSAGAFCSDSCRLSSKRRSESAKRKAVRQSLLRPTNCTQCGSPYTPGRQGSKFCSPSCRVKSHRRAMAQEVER